MGRVHYTRGENREAIGYYQQVLPVAQESDDPELLAIPANAIGMVMNVQGRLGKSMALLSQAIPLLEQTGNWPDWIRAVALCGGMLAAMGEYERGVVEAQRAIARAREMDSPTEIAIATLPLSFAHLFGGDLPSAIEAACQVIEVAEESGDRVYVYIGYGAKGWAEGRFGLFEDAINSMALSQTAAQELGGAVMMADWFAAGNAEIAFGVGRLKEALALAEQAVKIAQKMGGIFAEGAARRVWGQALAALTPPQWDEAEAQLAESLHVLESGQNRLEAARTHVAWGTVCRDRGDLAAAREHWEQAAAQWEKSELPWELEKVQTLIASLPEA
jgi:tetratricopeptide (TPR) repeat protein